MKKRKKSQQFVSSIAQSPITAVAQADSKSGRKAARKLLTIASRELSLSFDSTTGQIASLVNYGEECLAATGSYFVRFQTRNTTGNPRLLSDSNASSIKIRKAGTTTLEATLRFDRTYFPNGHFEVIVTASLRPSGALEWEFDFKNGTGEALEWIECPGLIYRNDFVELGGPVKVFSPAQEGAIIEGPATRAASWMRPKLLGYPTPGWGGYYPGPCQMQFMAYMRQDKGLYVAAHDRQGNTKYIEYYDEKNVGVRFEFQHFCSASTAKRFSLGYPMVMKPFRGDWHDAAELYRTWAEASISLLPAKTTRNKRMPKWVLESPLVVTYPIRGIGHHAGKTEPNEYAPPTEALPTLRRLAEKLDTKLLVLLMHWEGTAPWAPPYVWPPLGGEANMRRFAKELHKDGHRLGLYCSGTGWTQLASTGNNKYDRREEFAKKRLERFMCTGPRSEMWSGVCNDDSIRWGYDMCSATDFAVDTITNEAVKMGEAGVDYIQLFDQNLGCSSYICYSPNHGHPPGPGPWQRESMSRLLQKVTGTLRKKGLPTVLGCEAAAAEGYIAELPVNDLRAMLGWECGYPVPAYSYVYHEYTGNFYGNQCGILEMMDEEKSPLNYEMRAGMAFASGDILTTVIKDKGHIHWGWCVKWDVKPPKQEQVFAFTRLLLSWRRNQAAPFLVYGRMLKPFELQGGATQDIHMRRPITLKPNAIMSTRWQAPDGRQAQVFVNWTDKPQNARVVMDRARAYSLCLSETDEAMRGKGREVSLAMAPFSVGMLEYAV